MGASEFQANTNQTLTITVQPASGSSVCVGGAITATVSVTGTVTGHQWVKCGALLSPAQTMSALSLTNLQTGDAGSYSVVVTGACNSVTSTAFNLTVNALPAPTLTARNGLGVASTTITCAQTTGTPATLTLTASGGTYYQISGPGIVSQNPGAGTALVDASGTYSVTVTNTATGCSSVTSTTITSNTITPSVSVFPTLRTLTCSQTSITLTASGTGTSYSWAEGTNGPRSAGASLTVTNAGTYNLTAIGANDSTSTTSSEPT